MPSLNFTLPASPENGTSSYGYPGSTTDFELLVFAVYKMILSPVTALGNGFLVLIGIVDPLKSFQNASSLFLLTMSMANALTGVVVAPIFAVVEYRAYFGNGPLALAKFGSSFSLLTLNISFGMIFALVFDYFIAVFRPTKYRFWITKPRARICIVVVSLSALIFSILPYIGVPFDIVFKTDVHFNSTVNSLLIITSYALLYTAFRNRTKNRVGNLNGTTKHNEIQKILTLQKRFGRLLFVFVILSTVPAVLSTISYYIDLYCEPCQNYRSITLLQKVFLNLTFVKCALDPFAFGWRLPRHRQALRQVICRERGRSRQVGVTLSEL